jgi:hypothetical protein
MDAALPFSEARVATSVPARYLGQLCKHFAHRLPVTFDERQGRIEFPAGVCEIQAETEPAALAMRVTARDAADLPGLEDVVARHLARFAFREEPAISWTRSA